RLISRPADLATLHAALHFAIRLVQMRAVVEAAPLRRLGELGEVIAQRLRLQIPQAELADSRRVDQIRSLAKIVERRCGGRGTSGSAFVYVGNGEPEAAIERVENRRLADSAVAHESARLPLHGHAKCAETFSTLRR